MKMFCVTFIESNVFVYICFKNNIVHSLLNQVMFLDQEKKKETAVRNIWLVL